METKLAQWTLRRCGIFSSWPRSFIKGSDGWRCRISNRVKLAELKKWLPLAPIAERTTPFSAIAATVPAGDVKGIWRKAVDAGLVADDENGYASVRGDLAALRRDGVPITPSRAVAAIALEANRPLGSVGGGCIDSPHPLVAAAHVEMTRGLGLQIAWPSAG